jgi:hypothetical protein
LKEVTILDRFDNAAVFKNRGFRLDRLSRSRQIQRRLENHQRALGTETEAGIISVGCFSTKMNASVAVPQSAFRNPKSADASLPRVLLVIPRIYVGVILFISDLGKLTRNNPFADEMLRFLRGVTTRRASESYLHCPTSGDSARELV